MLTGNNNNWGLPPHQVGMGTKQKQQSLGFNVPGVWVWQACPSPAAVLPVPASRGESLFFSRSGIYRHTGDVLSAHHPDNHQSPSLFHLPLVSCLFVCAWQGEARIAWKTCMCPSPPLSSSPKGQIIHLFHTTRMVHQWFGVLHQKAMSVWLYRQGLEDKKHAHWKVKAHVGRKAEYMLT